MERNIRFVSMSDLHDKPKEIRVWLMGGEEMLLSHGGKPLAFIRSIREEDLDPPSKKMISLNYLRTHRDEFLYLMMTGEPVVLSFHNRTIALVSPNIPEEYLEQYLEYRQITLEERRKKRKKAPKKK